MRVLSFHPRSITEPSFRVFFNKRNGFYEQDRELHVLGLALIKVRDGSTTRAKIVPVFVYEGQTYFGAPDWDANKHDAEIVIVDPSVKNVDDYVYAEFARILPCPDTA